ncbi:MAG: hypothetical protein U0794_15765 [Isosphaeraceae bacterium]
MARWKAIAAGLASLSALLVAVAAAPAQVAKVASTRTAVSEMESDEQIVADFLWRKERAEKAQRAILARLRKDLDQRRVEFDQARKRFDEARVRYEGIIGPLPKQGVMNPSDPRLPYEFEVRRLWPEPVESKSGRLSQQSTDPRPN